MADTNLSTGKGQLNGQLLASASQLAGPAAQLASGASSMQVASGLLKDAFLDKLLGPAAAFTGVLAGSLLVMRKLVRESQILEKGLVRISQLQQIEGKFETLLKSAVLAKQRIKELYEFTKNSPFKFGDVAEANRQLEALTYGAFSGTKAMRMVGDAAAATGQSMSEMSERVGKLYAALSSGRSIDKIAFQLQFTGLATEGLLGKLEALEAAGAGFNEMWGEVEKVMSRTAGGMENEMQTLESLGAKLEEARSNMQKAFAEPFVEAQSNAIRTMTKATENLTPVLAQVGADIALVKGAVVDLKAGLMDVTLASPGMANALNVAWIAIKTVLVSLTALTAGFAVKNAASFGRAIAGAVGTAKSYLNLAETGSLLSRSVAANNLMLAKFADAQAAASAGSYDMALSLAAQAVWAKISAYVLAVHAAGHKAYAASSGLASLGNYAFAASSTVAAGALKGLGIVLGFVKRQLVSMVTALGIVGSIATVAAALVVALGALYRASRAVAKEFDQMASAAAATDAKLRELFATAKNTDDWAKAMAAVTEEIAKAEQALDDLQARAKERGMWDKVVGFFTGENIRLEGAQKEAARRPEMLRAQRTASLKQLPFMGMGSKQSEAYARDLQTAQATSDAALENRLQIADDAARVALLEKEADRLRKIADAAKAARDVMEQFNDSIPKQKADFALSDARDEKDRAAKAMADSGVDPNATVAQQRKAANDLLMGGEGGGNERSQKSKDQHAAIDAAVAATAKLKKAEEDVAALRRASASELVKTDQAITDIQAKGETQTDADRLRLLELQKQRIEIVEQVKNADQLAAAAQQRETDLARARDTQATNAAGAAFDPAIVEATAAGNGALVAQLQMKRELAVLEERYNQALRDNNQEQARALLTEAQLIVARKKAADAEFAAVKGAERAANAASISRDKKKAQAIQDEEALRQTTKEYEANGSTAAQAKADFEQTILAQAAGQVPTVVADSKQSIGGGGGALQGADPLVRAQERIARLNEQILGTLGRIDSKMGED